MCGRVVDADGKELPYATVYPIDSPVLGTISNDSGFFSLTGNFHPQSLFTISFLGYEKQTLPLSHFLSPDKSCPTIILKEQPIALKETLILSSHKRLSKKQQNIANQLYKVYLQMCQDFPQTPTCYHFVSDARMQSSGKEWGTEQLIGKAVVLPNQGQKMRNRDVYKDSIQIAPSACKRFFPPRSRKQADSILAQENLNSNIKKFALGVDSGIIIHKAFFEFGNAKNDFERYMTDTKKWKIDEYDNNQTILTYTQKHNYFGILIFSFQLHFVIDSKTLQLQRFYQTGEMKVNIPFGKKLDPAQLKILNLFNMSDSEIGKFRLRRFNANGIMNIFFSLSDNKLTIKEKNVSADMLVTGTKKMEIPLRILGTLKITHTQINCKALNKNEIKNTIQRQIVDVL